MTADAPQAAQATTETTTAAPESARVAPMPPGKGKAKGKAKAAGEKAPKAPKAPKEPKLDADGNPIPAKPRAPRQDYGYTPAAIIRINRDKEVTYKGRRADYYKLLAEHDGKTVNDFEGAAPQGDSPRGWLRFFCQDGACTLDKPKAEG